MWPESNENIKPLKSGLTTGCCATACCVAAAHYLLGKKKITKASVTLPKGKIVELDIAGLELVEPAESFVQLTETKHNSLNITHFKQQQSVRSATIKDAGDDPDATHGATIFVELKKISAFNIGKNTDKQIKFKAAKGVGTVTRDGLLLPIGEPAINPVPREMIIKHLSLIAKEYAYEGGFEVSVGVENGEQIALKTMNPRLGILGGLSILGTTGIVRPFSCSAYIASIHQGIDVANKNGYKHIAASTGSSSEAAIKKIYQLPEIALIEMGDFIGAVLKYLKVKSKKSLPGEFVIKKLSICGGFGKISKLAKGHLDLNSRVSSIDFEFLAKLAKDEGAEQRLQQKIITANTSIEALNYCNQENINLAKSVCRAALEKVYTIIPANIEVDVWAINRHGNIVAKAAAIDLPRARLK
ncbi:cobalt-precorrin-5B (C(1))-methyltransferase [Aliikangiella sp. IMCC44359]|uniref:cobalt-precorrin-5B (C(1))-methyltransferase n=1 Tax=Aliikangiella sp. IMCC44359 TaxID=3459125 RepID=UPI00403AD246